jgi:hypothetical protein
LNDKEQGRKNICTTKNIVVDKISLPAKYRRRKISVMPKYRFLDKISLTSKYQRQKNKRVDKISAKKNIGDKIINMLCWLPTPRPHPSPIYFCRGRFVHECPKNECPKKKYRQRQNISFNKISLPTKYQ